MRKKCKIFFTKVNLIKINEIAYVKYNNLNIHIAY